MSDCMPILSHKNIFGLKKLLNLIEKHELNITQLIGLKIFLLTTP